MSISSSYKQECTFEGVQIPHGAELCTIDLCKVCNDGKLEVPPELSMSEEELWADPAEAYFTPM